MAQPRRILWVRTDRLGETLLSLPAAASLKAALPEATVGCLVRAELAPLAAHAPGVDRVIPYSDQEPQRAWWLRAARLAASLRQQRWDAALIANPMKELHLAAWLARIPCRVGYDHKWSGLLTYRVPDRKQGERHEVDHNLDLVAALGLGAAPPASWRLASFAEEAAQVRQALAREGADPDGPVLAVHPWASTASKRWPLERFQQLLKRLRDQRHAVVVIGGPEWRHEAQQLAAPGAGAVNLVGRLTLAQLGALLERTRLLVSADSGPVHLAAAVGTPTVALFGAADPAAGPRRWGPWGDGHRVIARESMAAIGLEDVLGTVMEMLGCARRGS